LGEGIKRIAFLLGAEIRNVSSDNKHVDQCNWNKQSIINKSGVVKRSDEATPSGQMNKEGFCCEIKKLQKN
jgi:hypothetical protein